MKRRVADIIMDILVDSGITDCFAVVGGGAMHLDNALALNDKITKYFNHHEQACAMAAEAYARISGKMAAVCVTSGPGATNAITGVMGCWQDSLPMIVLSGQVRYEISVPKSGLPLRYRGIQEFEIIPSVKNMTKYAVMLTDPLEVKREVKKAIQIALSGRRGPVWLDVPLDIQSAVVEEDDMYPEEIIEPEIPVIKAEDISFIKDKLMEAKRPCILAGNGIANSHTIDEFRAFADMTGVPVIDACIAADAMYMDYPRYYGLAGSIGPRTGNFIVQNADVILSLGCSMGFKMTGFAQDKFAPKAYIIAVDADENEMKKPGVRIDSFIKADLKDFFEKSKEIGEIDLDKQWLDYCDKLKKRFSPFDPAQGLDPEERVCSYYFWQEYEKYEQEDSISILGNNTANSAKLQIGIKKKDQRIVANNNCGSMGADLPEAVGAAVAAKKEVICVTGDGSIMMNLQELQTIHHYKLPVKVIVFSNDGYNAIRQTSKNFFNGTIIGCTAETGVSFPEFKDVAKTFGFDYMLCNKNSEVDESLESFFKKEGNVLLEIKQRLDDPVTPKVMSRMNEDGSFSTPSLEDMAPFISQEEHDSLMFW